MNVKKIFVVLITIVACVIIGAFTLNILLPNVTTSIVDATEDMVTMQLECHSIGMVTVMMVQQWYGKLYQTALIKLIQVLEFKDSNKIKMYKHNKLKGCLGRTS